MREPDLTWTDDVATRADLQAQGATYDLIEAQLDARRWQPVGPLVVVRHNGPLTRQQQLRAAVLHVGPKGCLAENTALEVHGFRGLGTPDLEGVHVVHPRASTVQRLPWLHIHESRRLAPADIRVCTGLAVTSAARAAIDRAAWQPYPRFVYAVLAAVVQQRRTTPRGLSAELRRAGQVRHAHHLRLAIADIAAGAEALSEMDLGSLCRRHRLVPPARQQVRTDSRGKRRYLDAEWDLPDGSILVLEVDGSHHMEVEHWGRDMQRERRVILSSRRSLVLRCTAAEARTDDQDLVRDLLEAGVPRLLRPAA